MICQRSTTFGVIALFWVVFSLLTASAGFCTQEKSSSEAESAPISAGESPEAGDRKVVPVRTDQIDAAGEKVGAGIERLSSGAAVYLGRWVEGEVFFGITWIKLTICFFLLLLVVIVERLLRRAINRKIESIPMREGVISWLRIFLKAVNRPLGLFIWIYGIYTALSPLYSHFRTPDGGNRVHFVAEKAADIGGTLALFWFLYELVALIDARLIRWAESTESTVDNMLAPLVGKTLRIFIAVVGGMVVLQNLTGVQLGPLIASLGIGGLAVALAAKDTIANFFGTLTILFDKPFQVGERIVIDQYDGVVENVGFRSTRIRLLTGHLVSIPNEKLVNSSLENIGKRPYIRWLANIGITYDTPPEKVDKAVHIIESVLEDHEGLHPDFPPRVYFNGFNDWSLNIMVIAWYHPPNYWDMQAWLQRTCLEIMRRFKSEGIEFAFPSRTLYLASDEKRQLKMMIRRDADKPTTAPLSTNA